MDADRVVVRRKVSWAAFERFLARKGEKHSPHPKYLDGVLELVTPSWEHNKHNAWIGRLVEAFALDRGIGLSAAGDWTLKDKLKRAGLEPDECYVFGPIKKTPKRPHLAIEIHWSRSSVNKLEIYRRLRVYEVWLWTKPNVITVNLYRRGAWHVVERSPRFPDLDLAWLSTFLDRPTMIEAIRDFRAALQA